MEIADILIPEGVLPHLKVTSKKQALQELSRRAADVTGLEQREIFDVLLERERLGTTGMGNGIPYRTASCRRWTGSMRSLRVRIVPSSSMRSTIIRWISYFCCWHLNPRARIT